MRARRLGAGRVLPFQRVTAERLAIELQQLLGNADYARAASGICASVVNEDGAAAACDAPERLAKR